MSLLVASHLCKSYNKRTVVNDVSLTVNQGEIVGLLGPNGAGKTTSFYMIAGLVHPDKLLTNRTGKAGDILILTKPLGVGIYSAALKQGRLDAAGYAAMIASTTKLNTFGQDLGKLAGVHALTDVTGFGLLGHTLEMARGAGLTAELGAEPPLLPGVATLALPGTNAPCGSEKLCSVSPGGGGSEIAAPALLLAATSGAQGSAPEKRSVTAAPATPAPAPVTVTTTSLCPKPARVALVMTAPGGAPATSPATMATCSWGVPRS
jgi:energy-coupling factor transporter ATP-binding protein EcfA2